MLLELAGSRTGNRCVAGGRGECMLSNSIAEAANRETTTPEDLAALIESSANANVEKALGVPKSFLEKFVAQVELEIDRLSASAQGILVREFRQDLDRLTTTLRAMVRSCRSDPQDVNEELALASIVRDIADATDEYAAQISKPSGREQHAETLAAIEKDIKEVRLPWARKLLDRMTANDEMPAAERLTLSTSFFKEK